jgi:uncharacterized protein
MRRRTGIFDIVTLEGLLTAVVIGPNALSPMTWLPKVWGGKQPRFKDVDELNRYVALVMAYYNDIVGQFEVDPGRFEPTFYESRGGTSSVIIVDEWCEGFVKGMRLDRPGWAPLKRERPELLKPMELFGTRAGWRELKAGGEAAMHARWSVRVAPAVRAIHDYWLARRSASIEESGKPRMH